MDEIPLKQLVKKAETQVSEVAVFKLTVKSFCIFSTEIPVVKMDKGVLSEDASGYPSIFNGNLMKAQFEQVSLILQQTLLY